MLRAAKEIRCPVEGGIGICIGACTGIFGEGIAVLVLKELVFQIMRNALRHLCIILLAPQPEAGIDGAVFCPEQGKGRTIALHLHDIDFKPALMTDMQALFAGLTADNGLGHSAAPPCCIR